MVTWLFCCFQATGVKGETEGEQVAKRQKLGSVADNSEKAATSSSIDPEKAIDNGSKSMESGVQQSCKSSNAIAMQETPVLKPSLRPLMPINPSVVTNRFKLDNRPTAFKIVSTLPNDLANVSFFYIII